MQVVSFCPGRSKLHCPKPALHSSRNSGNCWQPGTHASIHHHPPMLSMRSPVMCSSRAASPGAVWLQQE